MILTIIKRIIDHLKHSIIFVKAEKPFYSKLYRKYGLSPDVFDTNVIRTIGTQALSQVFVKSPGTFQSWSHNIFIISIESAFSAYKKGLKNKETKEIIKHCFPTILDLN